MGVIASLALERKTSKGWQNVGDLLYPYGHEFRGKGTNKKKVKVPQRTICYCTVPHNRLVAAQIAVGGMRCVPLSIAVQRAP